MTNQDSVELSFFEQYLSTLCNELEAIRPGLSLAICNDITDDVLLASFERTLKIYGVNISTNGATGHHSMTKNGMQYKIDSIFAKTFKRLCTNRLVHAVKFGT
ncbi:hypothetical protein ACI2KR_07565 [Pseudomonas luteola]